MVSPFISKKHSLFCEYIKIFCIFATLKFMIMRVLFEKDYLERLYRKGDSGEKKHRFQPQVVKKYIQIVDLMIDSPNVLSLTKYNSLRYEKLLGDKNGLSSVRVNNQYRIEFEEITKDNETIATIVNIIELSNHYK